MRSLVPGPRQLPFASFCCIISTGVFEGRERLYIYILITCCGVRISREIGGARPGIAFRLDKEVAPRKSFSTEGRILMRGMGYMNVNSLLALLRWIRQQTGQWEIELGLFQFKCLENLFFFSKYSGGKSNINGDRKLSLSKPEAVYEETAFPLPRADGE